MSGMEKLIEVKPPPADEIVKHLTSEIDLPSPIIKLLVNRGYKTKDEIVSFLKPNFSNLHDPFLMRDMEKAADRVIGAVDKGELITLWGDYDVDGVTGIALLYRTLKKLGARLRFYIPHRKDEGYGLSAPGITEAREEGSSLIITVDCGITAIKEIELASKYGIDIIVTDHHIPATSVPSAFGILDPKCKSEHYPFDGLAGVGVAFKLAHAIWIKKRFPIEWLEEELDLVALGTIADVVPLIGENRILARIGLKKLNRTQKSGLKALLKLSGLSDRSIDTYDILFILGPRLNAPGRMAEARMAVELLISEDELEATELSKKLDSHNTERKCVEDGITSEAISMVEEANLGKDPILVLAKDNWHPGVIGICASRIVERYWRPAILIAFDGDLGKGSARSIPSFHICEALGECKEYLIDFGGHSQAAGLCINKENIDKFREKLKQVAQKRLKEEDLIPKTVVDMELSFSDIDEKFSKILRLFAPFGPSNPVPLFLTRKIEAVGTPKLVGENHLKVKLRHEGKVLSAIGFSLGEFLERIEIAKPELGVVYSITEDNYTGVQRLVLNLKHLWQLENRGDPI